MHARVLAPVQSWVHARQSPAPPAYGHTPGMLTPAGAVMPLGSVMHVVDGDEPPEPDEFGTDVAELDFALAGGWKSASVGCVTADATMPL